MRWMQSIYPILRRRYRSSRAYRGNGGRTKLGTASSVESAFGACELVCEITEKLAAAKCLAEYVWWNPIEAALCIAAAQATGIDCVSDCTSGGGGEGGGICLLGQTACGGLCCQPGEDCRTWPPIAPGGKPIHICCGFGEDCCR